MTSNLMKTIKEFYSPQTQETKKTTTELHQNNCVK